TDTIRDMTVEVTVTTKFGGKATKRVIISVLLAVDTVQDPSDITVLTGTERPELPLPAEAEVTLNNEEARAVGVAWNDGEPPYDGNRTGTYTFTGELVLPDTIYNPRNLKATVNVHVVHPGPT